MKQKKILIVIGTRPEAIKLAPVVRALRRFPRRFKPIILLTSQHKEMLRQALRSFSLAGDKDLKIMRSNQDLYRLTTEIILKVRTYIIHAAPDMVMVQGDTATAFASALAAFYAKIPVAHVEAGLRSFDPADPFPEEMNRVLIDRIAEMLFAPTAQAKKNLLREGIAPPKIVVTGNTVIDALKFFSRKRVDIAKSPLRDVDFSKKIVLVTAHRRESFGKPLENICHALTVLSRELDGKSVFVYPVHPNPHVRKTVFRLLRNRPNITLLEPLDYDHFVYLMRASHLIMTDSGGIQEEACFLGKPLVVLREKTERPEGVKKGNAYLVGTDPRTVVPAVLSLFFDRNAYEKRAQGRTTYGDGQASARIVRALAHYFDAR